MIAIGCICGGTCLLVGAGIVLVGGAIGSLRKKGKDDKPVKP